MHDADTLVERLGVAGTNPEVHSAAALVASAYATCDMETMLDAVNKFEVAVRQAESRTVARVESDPNLGT